MIISITHFLIDLWKLQYKRDHLKIFVLDQILHILVLAIIWLYLIEGFDLILPFLGALFSSPKILGIGIAYLLVIFPVGFMVGKATERWHDELETSLQKTSLKAAGRYIGIFERLMVLTFILTGHFSGIGFLIAAKSILRFSDKTETGARKQTEYVLIGTLMSFAITIIIGFLLRYISF